jgi:hypothetical protein
MQSSSSGSSKLQELGLDVSSSHDVPNLALPQLKYGYRTTPMSWSELRHIIETEKDLAKLSRSETQQREYGVFRYHLRCQYQSVLDYLLISKFGFDKQEEKDGRWQAHPQLADYSEVRTLLVPNDFPYSMADGIVHYIFWKTKQDITTEDIEEARKELHRRMDVVDTLYWVNPPHLKSLPEIDHVHFLCLLKRAHTTSNS